MKQVEASTGGSYHMPSELTVMGGDTLYFIRSTTGELWKSDGTPGGTSVVTTFPGGAFEGGVGFIEFNGAAYFGATTSGSGRELWKTDGTEAGTTLVQDINPGPASSWAGPGIAVDGTLFFAATHPASGTELWKLEAPRPAPAAPTGLAASAVSGGDIALAWTDASSNEAGFRLERSTSSSFATIDRTIKLPAGTRAHTDSGLLPGTTYHYRVRAYNRGGESAAAGASAATPAAPRTPLSLAATAPSHDRVELTWADASNGEQGFRIERSLYSDFRSVGATFTAAPGATAYADTTVSRNTHYFYRVYAFNAAGNSGRARVHVATPDVPPGDLVAFGIHAAGISLQWFDNPTTEYTYLVERATGDGPFIQVASRPANAYGYDDNNLASNTGYRYRVRAVGTTGATAYSNVTATVTTLLPIPSTPVKNLADVPPSADSDPDWLTPFKGAVYFTTGSGTPGGPGLWKTDGTAAGTVALRAGLHSGLTVAGGTLYFRAVQGDTGSELWKSDGTAEGTVLVKDITPGAASTPIRALVAGADRLYFTVDDGQGAMRLWKSDGTANGTVQVSDVRVMQEAFRQADPVAIGNTVYFPGWVPGAAGSGVELWKSDGTPGGTRLVKDVFVGSGDSRPYNLTAVGGSLFFAAWDPDHAHALWKTNGTESGAVLVKDVYDGVNSPPLSELTASGATLYFAADDPTTGLELWKSDGTPGGTVLVGDLAPGPDNDAPRDLIDVNGTLYFTSYVAGQGTALWKTDGTPQGTILLRNLAGGSPFGLISANGTLFYVDGGYLWRSDGTPAGISRVRQTASFINYEPTAAGRWATVLGDQLLLRAYDPAIGRELFRVATAPPAAPSGLVAAAGGGTSLRWNDNADDETGFVIERSTRSDFATLDRLFFPAADATTLTDATAPAGSTFYYRARAVNAAGDSSYAIATAAAPNGTVAARRVFYNNSSLDGNDAAANAADDAAVDSSKSPLLPGGSATAAARTGYSKGINGLMLDVLNLPNGGAGLDAADFSVRRTTLANPAWVSGPLPTSMHTRPGPGGATRVTLLWSDAVAVKNGWLEVTVKQNGDTGLAAPDVFMFANLVGDANGDGSVNVTDLGILSTNFNKSPRTISQGDFTGDGRVNVTDLGALSTYFNKSLPNPPAAAVFSDIRVTAAAPRFTRAAVRLTTPARLLDTEEARNITASVLR